jgi:hypothetical protein
VEAAPLTGAPAGELLVNAKRSAFDARTGCIRLDRIEADGWHGFVRFRRTGWPAQMRAEGEIK